MWEIRIGIFLALVNFGTLIVLIYQTAEMRRSTNAATQAAAAAQDSVKQGRESARLDQRAWVAVSGIVGVPEVGEDLSIPITYTNTGRTFATNVRLYSMIQIRGIADPIPTDPLDNRKASSVSLMPPNFPHTTGKAAEKHIISQQEIDALKSKEAILYIRTKATYTDVFGCGHWTMTCARFDPDNGGWRTCGSQNEAGDDACTE